MPKERKLSILEAKFSINNALARKAAIKPGLHGITMAPKKKPNPNALFQGFLLVFTLTFGKNLPKSKSNIKNILIIPNMAKAIGETIAITLVKDCCKRVVKISPKSNIKIMTPETTIAPNKAYDFLFTSPENLVERKAKNPGYKGKTQTAVKGVRRPNTKEVIMSKKRAIVIHPSYQHPFAISSFNLSTSLEPNPPSFLKLPSSQIKIIGTLGALTMLFPNSSIKLCVSSMGEIA